MKMKAGLLRWKTVVILALMLITVLSPIFLYTDTRFSIPSSSSFILDPIPENTSIQQVSTFAIRPLNVLPQESLTVLKQEPGIINVNNSDSSRKTRQLTEEDNHEGAKDDNPIRQVTEEKKGAIKADDNHETLEVKKNDPVEHEKIILPTAASTKEDPKIEQHPAKNSRKDSSREALRTKPENQNPQRAPVDARVRHLKDQLIRAKIYLSLTSTRNNPHYVRELRLRMKDVQRVLGDSTKDSELPRSAVEKMKAMEETLVKGRQMQDDCSAVVKKLRAIIHSTEEQLRVHKKQALFLTHLTAKTLPKGLHCLPLRLTTEYFTLNTSERHFPNQEKLEDPRLYHYALFSDNVLAAAVVVNSTVSNAKDPSNHVFHVVTDRLNYAAMRMWFLVNPPGKATIQVQNVEEFTWLNGKVIGVVETCGESFHRFDRYLNFSNPLISKIFDPRACGWAFGMNVFDLEEWRRQNITEVYHSWQNLNHDRQLWKLGTLPPGLITFWKRTFSLDRSWHVLGLGYNPNVNQKDIERAAVVHYNGNLKPWLEIGIPKFKSYWTRYIDYDQQYLRECNLSP
ncbi:Hexosyltransferase [Heracleum sosnowskyi]|uniref:Hexosyltransferase n=1 Tax=Heracleum sosnowskyi TaxID=360622 RepID=A0AAD8GMU5_9APIA|nr:Hexosyltransferase [Heracleum sosnowskyi]